MTMSTTRKCDRCGMTAIVEPRRRAEGWASLRVSWTTRQAPQNFDLCDACTKALREFVSS